jgi:hypothetical protein
LVSATKRAPIRPAAPVMITFTMGALAILIGAVSVSK